MNERRYTIRLSSRELMYLKNTNFLPESLARVIETAQLVDDGCTIYILRELAEQFRSVFTDQMARVGFNADYDPTSEGKMLEELIDRFYLA